PGVIREPAIRHARYRIYATETYLSVQVVLHPLWCWGGARLAAAISGQRAEQRLMLTLAVLTVGSVLLVLVKEG
ncbi:MAG: LysE family translocator, partial [Pseudomonadota bacterium]